MNAALPIVADQLRIAAPCDRKWEDMQGDNRRRYCGDCQLFVYNIPKMSPEDLVDGTERLWTGSLLKVYGHVTDAGTEETGPTIQVDHYRHFPHGTFVTTAAAGSMRR